MNPKDKYYLWKLLDHPEKEKLERLLGDFDRVDPEASRSYGEMRKLDEALRTLPLAAPRSGFSDRIMAALPPHWYPLPKWSAMPFLQPGELLKFAAMVAVIFAVGWASSGFPDIAGQQTVVPGAYPDPWMQEMMDFLNRYQYWALIGSAFVFGFFGLDKALEKRYSVYRRRRATGHVNRSRHA